MRLSFSGTCTETEYRNAGTKRGGFPVFLKKSNGPMSMDRKEFNHGFT